MKKTDKKVQEFTTEKLTFSEMENHLKLHSGLSYIEAKELAKHLSIEQSIQIEEALRYILWANGFPSIKKCADAIPEIIKLNFGIDINGFGLLIKNGKPEGYYFSEPNGCQQLVTCSFPSKSYLIDNLMRMLNAQKEHKSKSEKFLVAVKKCIKEIGHDFYSLPKNKKLDDVINLLEIDIDLEKLLHGGSGCNSTMRYALASCYNDYDTARSTLSMTLLNKHKRDGLKTLKVTDESSRNDVYNYMNTYQTFGSMCIHLEGKNKEIVKGLIDNYCGW
jgi:hypothetical protein